MKEITVETVRAVDLPQTIGAVIVRLGTYASRPYPELVAIRTGMDGWRVTGEVGYTKESQMQQRVIQTDEFSNWKVLYDPAD